MKNTINYRWITILIISSFLISIIFTLISELAIPNVGIILGIIITLLFIFIGVMFDMIGVAIATADESVFHSMASKKVKGAKTAIKLKKNADKMASFFNDVIGDICGIVSGSTGTVITLKIIEKTGANDLLITLIIVGFISALTIGGKALEKGYAMKESNKILIRFSKIISMFSKE